MRGIVTEKEEKRGHFVKAKVQLVLNHSFFSVLSCHLPTVEVGPEFFLAVQMRLRREMGNPNIVIPPTALVDGKNIYYNGAWVEKMPEKQRLGLLAHEVMHPALQHPWRRGNRRMDLWHKATDYAVNDIILRTVNPDGKQAFELPPGGLHDPRFAGMAAEQIYNILLKEEQEQEEQEKKGGKPKAGNGKGKGEALDTLIDKPIDPDDPEGKGTGKKGKKKDEPKEQPKGGKGKDDKPEKGKDQKPKGGGKKDKEDKEQGDEMEDDAPSSGQGPKADKRKDDEPEEGEGEGQDGDEGEEGDEQGDGQQGDGEGDGSEDGDNEGDADDGDGEGEGEGSDGEPGDSEPHNHQHEGDGGHMDHAVGAIDESDAGLQEEWKDLLQQAALVAKLRGQLPGQLARLVEEVTEPKVPWQSIIEQFVNDVVRDDYDMMKQDRRFMQSGIYFPELQSNATTVAAFLDTSGSIGQKELQFYVSEVASICRCRGVKFLRLIACDAAITMDLTLGATDQLPDNFPGGGGTDFRPPFKRVLEEGERPSLIIYFTDLCGTFPERDPGIPTIWLWSRPAWTKDSDAPEVPFGTVIAYDPEEERVGAV